MARCNPCGDWPDFTKKGQCAPRRLKISCDGPIGYTNEAQSVTLECEEGAVGDPITITVDAGTVNSPFSQEDANARALAQAQAIADALRAANPCVFLNEEQTCIDECPGETPGDPIEVTIPAGTFAAATLEEANALALAAACAQAAAMREDEPCGDPPPPPDFITNDYSDMIAALVAAAYFEAVAQGPEMYVDGANGVAVGPIHFQPAVADGIYFLAVVNAEAEVDGAEGFPVGPVTLEGVLEDAIYFLAVVNAPEMYVDGSDGVPVGPVALEPSFVSGVYTQVIISGEAYVDGAEGVPIGPVTLGGSLLTASYTAA